MDIDEFNAKWAAYLAPGHYGCIVGTPEMLEVLDKAFDEWKDEKGFLYMQVKAKFDSIRLYTSLPFHRTAAVEQELQRLYDAAQTNPSQP
jgi:hypothetical protein